MAPYDEFFSSDILPDYEYLSGSMIFYLDFIFIL